MYIRYLIPTHQDILLETLLSVPDAPNGDYQFAGVPDGLGAFQLHPGDKCFEVVVTHELRYNAGRRRAHACSGAFVSRWTIDTMHWDAKQGKGRLGVTSGRDQIQCVHAWVHRDGTSRTSRSVPIERLCSADLPDASALFFNDGGEHFGTHERIFLGGEETHTYYKLEHGRAFAHILTGSYAGHSFELPHLGRLSFENVLACPFPQRKTIVVCPDDARPPQLYDTTLASDRAGQTNSEANGEHYNHYEPPSELYVYVGEKQAVDDPASRGSNRPPHEMAGLTGGRLFGVQVVLEDDRIVRWEHREFGFGYECNAYVGKARFRLVDLGVRSQANPLADDDRSAIAEHNPGVALQRDSIRLQITQFLRLEDGAWDPRPNHQNEFYFGTTDSFDGNSRLFRLTFDDLSRTGDSDELAGTIEILLNARVDPEDDSVKSKFRFHSLDSITVDKWGRVFMQEDPGGETYFTRTLMHLPDSGELYCVAEGNPEVFGRRGAHFLTTDEEAAGIIPVFELLGDGWYLTAIQANTEENWARKIFPGQLSYEEQLQLETDLVAPGQLCAMYIPKGIEDKLSEVEPHYLHDIACCERPHP